MKIGDKAAELLSRALWEMERDLNSPDELTRQSAVDQIVMALYYNTREADYVEPPDDWAKFYEKVEPEEKKENEKSN